MATNIGRRQFIKTVGTTLGGAAAASITAPYVARAQGAYPNRQVRIVVPAPPAGITDLSARLVAEGLRAKFNQPFIVENKSGGNGLIGLREMVRSAPDGYTLMVGTVGTTVINFAIDSTVGEQLMIGTPPHPFDPGRDMVPIAGTAEYACAMVVNKNMPVKTVADFVAYAKERPGKLTFGSTGVGALDFVAAELFMKSTGIKMVHVPYRGGPLALNDLMGGTIDTIIEVYPVVMEQIRSGAIKGLAVSTSYRLKSNPDLPTFAEAGVTGMNLAGWGGVYGPPGLPHDIVETLGAAIVEVVKQPEVQDKFRVIGFEPAGLDVQAFTKLHNAEIRRWTDFLTEMGLRK